MYKIKCVQCGKHFETKVGTALYCSPKCSNICWKAKIKKLNPNRNSLISSLTGKCSEMRVSLDLFQKGWEVFDSLSPASPFDLVAYKNGKFISFQVRTGSYQPNGSIDYTKKQSLEADYFAIVLHDQIIYSPVLP